MLTARAVARSAVPVAALVALALVTPAASPPDRAGLAASDRDVTASTAARTSAVRAEGGPGGRLVRPGMRRVVAISVDGLNPAALGRLGPEGAPAMHRIMRRGASTLAARAAVEQTVTLPNHTGMLTSRRVETRRGHGIDVNDDPGGTVSEFAGHEVQSVYSRLRAGGARGNLYAGKEKFALFDRSWGRGIARYVHRENGTRGLMGAARYDLVKRPRPFAFVHLATPDVVGHRAGWLSPPYLDAVRRVDRAVGDLLATLDERPALKARTTVLLTSDHGGTGTGHSDPTVHASYRVAFMAFGAGVAKGADLYRLNPQLQHPGRGRPSYAAERQPVRNAAVANLALDLLGRAPVAGSEINAGQRLRLR